VFIFFFLFFTFVVTFYIFDLYNVKITFFDVRRIAFFLGASAFVLLLGIGWFYLFPFGIGRGIFILSFSFICILSFLWRIFFSSFFRLAIQKRNVLVVGTKFSRQIPPSFLLQNPEFRVVGFLADRVPKINSGDPFQYLGKINELKDIVRNHQVDDIVLTVEPGKNRQLKRDLVDCRLKGIRVTDLSTLYEYLMDKLPVLCIKDHWFLYSQGFERVGSRVYKRLKRGFDLFVSLVGIIISLPLTLVIAGLIKATSKGPLFYIQERLGENEKPYKLYKFRTMVVEAERKEPKWAEENDPRVTSVGKVLRKMRVDELPQLINVLKGDMSMIGPRPERKYFIRRLKEKIPYYSLRFALKPGLTGWAQVNYKYGSTVEDAIEKLRYDLYYIKNMSLFLDLRILLKTVRVSLFGMGR